MAKEPKAKEHSKKSKAKEYTKTCLEDSTERSESNPGQNLGIKAITRTAVWKTVPTKNGSYLFYSEKWKVKSEEWKIALTQLLNEEWRMKNEEFGLRSSACGIS